MYRCFICGECSRPGEPLRQHIVKEKLRGLVQITQANPVCLYHSIALEKGVSLSLLRKRVKPSRKGIAPPYVFKGRLKIAAEVVTQPTV